MASELGVVVVGFLAGIIAGMLGVGGGALFSPALVLFLGESQLHAEATSLVAIVPTALAGAWSQRRYGNLRLREGVLMGSLALGGRGGRGRARQRPGRAAAADHLRRRSSWSWRPSWSGASCARHPREEN